MRLTPEELARLRAQPAPPPANPTAKYGRFQAVIFTGPACGKTRTTFRATVVGYFPEETNPYVLLITPDRAIMTAREEELSPL